MWRQRRQQVARRITQPAIKPNGNPEKSLGTSTTAVLAVSHGIMRTTTVLTNNPGTSREPPTRTKWEEAPKRTTCGKKPPPNASKSTAEGVGLQIKLIVIIMLVMKRN